MIKDCLGLELAEKISYVCERNNEFEHIFNQKIVLWPSTMLMILWKPF